MLRAKKEIKPTIQFIQYRYKRNGKWQFWTKSKVYSKKYTVCRVNSEKLDKRQDEFHDSNLTVLAYTSDGDVYHIKTDVREYSENDIAIEGACYKGTENVVRLLEK